MFSTDKCKKKENQFETENETCKKTQETEFSQITEENTLLILILFFEPSRTELKKEDKKNRIN